jgi:hypothetical protein
MTAQVLNPFIRFVDKTTGRPLNNAQVYFGKVATDPKNNVASRITVKAVQPNGSEVTIAQPVTTNTAGYMQSGGSVAQLTVVPDATEDAYCIQVFDESGVQQFYAAEVNQMIDFPTLADPASNIVISGMPASTIVRKANEFKTVADYGVVGDGIANDTAALQAALNDGKYVIVPDGFKMRITGTITIPVRCTLFFQGGFGNTSGNLPSNYIIKDGSLATRAVVLQETAAMIGGGVVAEAGNLGDGIVVWGNSVFLDRVVVTGCGGDGIRVGKDSAYQNCNSYYINRPICFKNGGQGIHLHDGFEDTNPNPPAPDTRSSDCNAGTLIHPFCYQNGGSGILVKRAWWVTIINALTEGNTAWGLFADSTIVAPDTVARCRYLNIFGGDFNEGNGGGSIFFGGYAGNYFHASANQALVVGGVLNNIYGGGGDNLNWGQTINRFLTINEEQDPVTTTTPTYPVSITKPLTGTAGEGVGLEIRCDNLNVAAPPYAIAATFAARYRTPGNFEAVTYVRKGANLIPGLVVDPEFQAIMAGEDNQWRLGTTNRRFNLLAVIHPVYASDAAAIAGGLTTGCHYHNGDGIVRMVR